MGEDSTIVFRKLTQIEKKTTEVVFSFWIEASAQAVVAFETLNGLMS